MTRTELSAWFHREKAKILRAHAAAELERVRLDCLEYERRAKVEEDLADRIELTGEVPPRKSWETD